MNAEKYKNLLEKTPIIKCVSLNLTQDWIFQQDNDPKHTAKLTQNWFTTVRRVFKRGSILEENNIISVARWVTLCSIVQTKEHAGLAVKKDMIPRIVSQTKSAYCVIV